MKKFGVIVLAVVCGLVLFAFAKADFMADKYYGVFIGIEKEDGMKLNNYKVLVLEPTEFNKDDIKKLHEKNKKIYAYLNIGSLENYRPYYEEFKDKTLGAYENWEDEYWMDVSDKHWQNLIVDDLGKSIADKGFDGFFIDNCDVYYQYSNDKIYDGLCSILKGLQKYNIDTIINGGDTFVSKCIDEKIANELFDGINQECVFTDIDFEHKTYTEKSMKEREYFIKYLENVKSQGLKVYILEYGANKSMLREIENFCNENGFHFYNAKSLELS